MATVARTPSDQGQYVIFIDEKENKRNPAPQKISHYATPTSDAEMRRLIGHAELEGDPKVVSIYDRALAPYCNNPSHLKALLHDDVRYRILCLDLPQSKRNLIGTLNSVVETRRGGDLPIKHHVKDDQDSTLAALFKEACTENRLSDLRKKYAQDGIGVQTPSAFAEELLEYEEGERSRFLKQQDPSLLFYYLLTLLDATGGSNQDACRTLFLYLNDQKIWKQLSQDEIRDFTWLVLHHSSLLSLLQSNPHDRIEILCKARETGEVLSFTASRFLLATQSEYFYSLLTSEEDLETLDLSKTSFDNRTIELLHRWVSHLRTSMFAFDEQTTVKDLENLLASVAGFGLVNQKEFEEALIIELKKRLTIDTLKDITQIGLRYHLNLLVRFCMHFINSYEEGNIWLQANEEGFFEVMQYEDGHDLPQQVYETLVLLGPKIHSASIETFRPQASKGCCSRAVKRLKFLSHSFWDKCGGLIKRTGCFALSIFAIEKMAHEEWTDERDFPLSVGLGLVYPLFCKVVSRCTDRIGRNRPIAVTLPGIVPLGLQFKVCDTVVAVQEKTYGCAQRCFKRRRTSASQPLVLRQNPLLAALPRTLQSLKIASASDLTDQDLAQISTQYPALQHLELGYHPHLSGRNFQFLTRLNLQELGFTFQRGERALALENLRLDELLPQSSLKIKISLFDTTLVYFLPQFLRTLPPAATLHVTLKHAPISSGLVLFESPSGTSKAAPWPGVAGALDVGFPRMNSLDCQSPLSDDDLAIISTAIAPCHRLILRQGDLSLERPGGIALVDLSDAAIQIIADNCTRLEELFIAKSCMTTVQPFIEKRTPLKKVGLCECVILNPNSLEQLATLPTLNFCYFDRIPTITDPDIQKLLDKPAIQEVLARDCDGVSTRMLTHLFYRKAPSKTDAMKKAVHEIHQLFENPLPEQLAQKFLLTTLFQFVHTFIPVIAGRRGNFDLQQLLGLTPEVGPVEVPLSLLEAMAQFSWNPQHLVDYARRSLKTAEERMRMKEGTLPLDPFGQAKMRLVGLHALSQEVIPYREKIADSYRLFLRESFSSDYVREVETLTAEFTAAFNNAITFNGDALKKELQELIPLIFLSKHRAMFKCANIFLRDNNRLRDFFRDFAGKIKTKGDLQGWSPIQREIPIFACILFNLNCFADALVPSTDASFPEITVVDFDEKEEKKERKLNEKEIEGSKS